MDATVVEAISRRPDIAATAPASPDKTYKVTADLLLTAAEVMGGPIASIGHLSSR